MDTSTILTPTIRRKAIVFLLGTTAFEACTRTSGERDLDIDALPLLNVEEVARIGSVDDPNIGFSRILAVDVDRDGNVYALEGVDTQIRVYAPDGRLLRRIGGPGEGPGEFQHPPRFGVDGDTVWAIDSGARRITLFDRSGTVLSTGRIADLLIPIPYGFIHVMPIAMRPDGTFTSEVMRVSYSRPDDPPTGVQPGDSMPVPRVRFAATGAVIDTIGWEASPRPRMVPPPDYATEDQFRFITAAGSRHPVPDPPTSLADWIALHDGRIIIDQPYATVADAGEFRVTRLALSGDTVYSRRFPYRPRAYSSTELDSIAARAARGGNRFINGQPIVTPPDEVERVQRALRAAMTFPEFKQPIAYTWLDADERLWMRRRTEDVPIARWIILDPRGMPLGEVELPGQIRVMWSRGSELWAVGRDELDVPWLVHYRIADRLSPLEISAHDAIQPNLPRDQATARGRRADCGNPRRLPCGG